MNPTSAQTQSELRNVEIALAGSLTAGGKVRTDPEIDAAFAARS
jgi:hypothetical protein